MRAINAYDGGSQAQGRSRVSDVSYSHLSLSRYFKLFISKYFLSSYLERELKRGKLPCNHKSLIR